MTGTTDLERYQVIDSLEVGPVELKPASLRVPYRVTVDGAVHETRFGYRFRENVFDPGSESDRNLAAMMAVQPAFNYGLFCRRIRFLDSLDEADRAFIDSMTENTSREILVKKLLEPNPFLLPGWQLRNVPDLDRYTTASLVFDSRDCTGKDSWNGRENGFCVLSSGGKESLLSYGLLAELGCETHPVYINESGRHWFTALNGFRYFEQNIPHNARVWSDCDRLFNWMIRKIRFIRPDYNRLRADDYPLRLWTVAVFLFGSLPLMKKRELTHLVVGNEFDTSRYFPEAQLPHYDGLFDQSRWFDHYMSDYFSRKGWSIHVRSIVRNLSETLVEKVLANRYPDLFSSQVSCHAARMENGRVRPCGKCEKCRRIISILTAIGIDPGLIGYTEEMKKQALKTLKGKGLHSQLAGEFLQVLEMLGGASCAQEIEHLRISEENAPLSDIPALVRQPLLRILQRYSKGILKREGSTWKGVSDDSWLSDSE